MVITYTDIALVRKRLVVVVVVMIMMTTLMMVILIPNIYECLLFSRYEMGSIFILTLKMRKLRHR